MIFTRFEKNIKTKKQNNHFLKYKNCSKFKSKNSQKFLCSDLKNFFSFFSKCLIERYLRNTGINLFLKVCKVSYTDILFIFV